MIYLQNRNALAEKPINDEILFMGYPLDSGCLDVPHRLVQTSRTSHKILGLPESNGEPLTFFCQATPAGVFTRRACIGASFHDP